MAQSRTNRFFSLILLLVYSGVIFHEGVFSGWHIISHVPEVMASQFTFHSHDDGHMHMHHHNLLDALSSVLHVSDETEHSTPASNKEGKDWSKIHVIAEDTNLFKTTFVNFKIHPFNKLALTEVFRAIITPPPEYQAFFCPG